MVLESTIICIDNSEYSRNGDSNPTRLWAQRDAANYIARNKIRDNPENEVGIITMSDNFVRCSLTAETAKLNSVMSQVQPENTINLNTSIRVAQLALKHRMNKHHRQRIVLFLCSPLESEGVELIRTAKRLKKEKVNVDIISFGEDATEFNQTRLEGIHRALNTDDSTLTTVAPDGINEALRGLATLAITETIQPVMNNEFGETEQIDEELDPELALALRISLEEERARQEKHLREEAEDEKKNVPENQIKKNESFHTEEMSEEIASLMLNNVGLFSKRESIAEMKEEFDIDEVALAEAIRMSTMPVDEEDDEIDQDALQQILEGLPGVDSDEVKKNMKKDAEK